MTKDEALLLCEKQFRMPTLFLRFAEPKERPWVGLTDEEMESIFLQCGGKWNGDFWTIEDADFHPFLRTIEAKLKAVNGFLKEKNA
jgi:hypothetical protein